METKNLNEHTPLQQLFTGGARLFSEMRGAKGSSAVYSKKFAALCINGILLKRSANRFEFAVNLFCNCVRNLTANCVRWSADCVYKRIGTLVSCIV